MPVSNNATAGPATSFKFSNVLGVPGAPGTPGGAGPAGTAGAAGPQGQAAFTTLTAGFTQPAVNGAVAVTVASTGWMALGMGVYIATGGYYTVTTISTSTGATLTNTGATGNAAPAATISSPQVVTAGGAPGAIGPAGPAGSPAIALFSGLAATAAPASGHGSVTLEGYTAQGDSGNGKIAIWVASSTATPNTTTVSYALGSPSPGRWVVAASTINVKDFGATGNGTIDDTTAIQAAASVFTAAMVANVSTRLYFPAGKYLISAPIAVQGIVGGVIEGDGMYASQIVGNSNVSGLRGALGVLVLTNCQHVTVRDISVSSGNQFTTFTGCSAGALSITVTSATGLVAGMRTFVCVAVDRPHPSAGILTGSPFGNRAQVPS